MTGGEGDSWRRGLTGRRTGGTGGDRRDRRGLEGRKGTWLDNLYTIVPSRRILGTSQEIETDMETMLIDQSRFARVTPSCELCGLNVFKFRFIRVDGFALDGSNDIKHAMK